MICDIMAWKSLPQPTVGAGICWLCFCWMLEGFILIFVSLWVGEYLITEYDLLSYLIAPDGSPFVQWALLILFLLIVLGALGVLILWGICAGRMKKTYRLLKGISE